MRIRILTLLILCLSIFVSNDVFASPDDIEIENIDCDSLSDVERANIHICQVTDGGFQDSGIFSSVDPDVRVEEADEFYIKYFFEAHIFRSFPSLNNGWFDFDDTLVDALVSITTLLSNLINLISFLINMITMLMTTMYTNNVIASSFMYIISFLNDSVFNFESLVGAGMTISLFITILIIIKNLFQMIKDNESHKSVLKMVFSSLAICMVIPLSYTVLRPELHNISNGLTNTSMSLLYGENTSYEIQLKRDVFSATRFSLFLKMNYDVSSLDELYKESDSSFTDDMDTEEIKEIVNRNVESTLNMTLSTADARYSSGKYVIVDPLDALYSLIYAFFGLINSLLLFILLSISFMFVEIINIIEVIAFGFIWVNILLMLFNYKERNIFKFILNRFKFLIAVMLIRLSFVIFLQFILTIINFFLNINLFVLLLIEFIMIILVVLVIKNFRTILKAVKRITGSIDKGIIQTGKGIINGDYTFKDFKGDLKSMKSSVKSEVTKLYTNNVEVTNNQKTQSSTNINNQVYNSGLSDVNDVSKDKSNSKQYVDSSLGDMNDELAKRNDKQLDDNKNKDDHVIFDESLSDNINESTEKSDGVKDENINN